jgi:hypothetical protein
MGKARKSLGSTRKMKDQSPISTPAFDRAFRRLAKNEKPGLGAQKS